MQVSESKIGSCQYDGNPKATSRERVEQGELVKVWSERFDAIGKDRLDLWNIRR